MEIYLSRDEIVRRACARMGWGTNQAQAPLIRQQMEEYARAAALEVFEWYEFANVQRETRVLVGIDQRVINYPTDCTAANILSLGLWDETRYLPMQQRILPISEHDDPLVDEGEPASVSGRGRPCYFECKAQIRISPRPDQAYEIKILHTISPDLATGSTVCVVDSEAVIIKVIEMKRGDDGDDALAAVAAERFEARMKTLGKRQSNAHAVKRNSGYRARANARGGDCDDFQPNSGQWPSVMP